MNATERTNDDIRDCEGLQQEHFNQLSLNRSNERLILARLGEEKGRIQGLRRAASSYEEERAAMHERYRDDITRVIREVEGAASLIAAIEKIVRKSREKVKTLPDSKKCAKRARRDIIAISDLIFEYTDRSE